jgi:Tfp pilus assembly pilus retraction ATPase PilT
MALSVNATNQNRESDQYRVVNDHLEYTYQDKTRRKLSLLLGLSSHHHHNPRLRVVYWINSTSRSSVRLFQQHRPIAVILRILIERRKFEISQLRGATIITNAYVNPWLSMATVTGKEKCT